MVCRLCLQGSERYKSVFDTEGIEFNIANLIWKYLHFEVTVNDTISTYICNSCWGHLENFHKFYCNVQEAQSKLSNEIYIKQEEQFFENENNSSREEINKSIQENDIIKNLNEIKTKEIDIDEVVNSINKLNEKIEAMKEQIQIERRREEEGYKNPSLSENSLDVNSEISNSGIIQFINKENCEPGLEESQEKQQYSCDDYRAENKKKEEQKISEPKRSRYINKHLNPNYIKCELCDKFYADKGSLKLHHVIMHTPEDQKIHKCDICSKSFPKIYMLEAHKITHMPKEERKYHCEQCGNAFPSKHRLQTHIRLQHEKAYRRICNICGRELRSITLLRKHQLKHDGIDEPKVQCQKCGAWLKNDNAFRVHMVRHREKEKSLIDREAFKCNICGKSFTTKGTLSTHIRYIHKLKSTHQCNVCSKSFSLLLNLEEHMSTHTGEDLYGCNYCPKTCKSRSYLYSHRKKMHRKEWEEERKNPSEKISTKNTEEKGASQKSDKAYYAKEENAPKIICENHEES